MGQTILVVEDDLMIRKLVSTFLTKQNFHVVEAGNGYEAKEIFLTYRPCLILLDLMMPVMSGEEFVQWLREEKHADVAIIMLTAKARVSDRITGLKLGADAYLTKPFDLEELLAQVEAVLRRTGQFCEKITIDGLTIMPRRHEVFLYDQRIHLTKHEFNLLHFLMQHPNTVFTREQLVNELYPTGEQTIMDRTIDAHIKKLREKIEANTSEPERIQTVRGMGYKFVDE